jgi:hypothetical protein
LFQVTGVVSWLSLSLYRRCFDGDNRPRGSTVLGAPLEPSPDQDRYEKGIHTCIIYIYTNTCQVVFIIMRNIAYSVLISWLAVLFTRRGGGYQYPMIHTQVMIIKLYEQTTIVFFSWFHSRAMPHVFMTAIYRIKTICGITCCWNCVSWALGDTFVFFSFFRHSIFDILIINRVKEEEELSSSSSF